MSNINVHNFTAPLNAEGRRLEIKWDEGTPFTVELRRMNAVNGCRRVDLFDNTELFEFDRRKYGTYAEFLSRVL